MIQVYSSNISKKNVLVVRPQTTQNDSTVNPQRAVSLRYHCYVDIRGVTISHIQNANEPPLVYLQVTVVVSTTSQ